MGQFGEQRQGQSHHPIISALGAADAEPASFQVDVLNAQIEWFGDAQATTIEHSCDEIRRVRSLVADGLEERLGLGNGWCVALVNWTRGPKSLNVAKGLAQHVLVKKQDRVKSL